MATLDQTATPTQTSVLTPDQQERARLNQQVADHAASLEGTKEGEKLTFDANDPNAIAKQSLAWNAVDPGHTNGADNGFNSYLNANSRYYAAQSPDQRKKDFDSLYGQGPKVNGVSGASSAINQKIQSTYAPQVSGIKQQAEDQQQLSYFDQQHQQLGAANQVLAASYTADITQKQKDAQDAANRAGVMGGVLGIVGGIAGAVGGFYAEGPMGSVAGAQIGAGAGQAAGSKL